MAQQIDLIIDLKDIASKRIPLLYNPIESKAKIKELKKYNLLIKALSFFQTQLIHTKSFLNLSNSPGNHNSNPQIGYELKNFEYFKNYEHIELCLDIGQNACHKILLVVNKETQQAIFADIDDYEMGDMYCTESRNFLENILGMSDSEYQEEVCSLFEQSSRKTRNLNYCLRFKADEKVLEGEEDHAVVSDDKDKCVQEKDQQPDQVQNQEDREQDINEHTLTDLADSTLDLYSESEESKQNFDNISTEKEPEEMNNSDNYNDDDDYQINCRRSPSKFYGLKNFELFKKESCQKNQEDFDNENRGDNNGKQSIKAKTEFLEDEEKDDVLTEKSLPLYKNLLNKKRLSSRKDSTITITSSSKSITEIDNIDAEDIVLEITAEHQQKSPQKDLVQKDHEILQKFDESNKSDQAEDNLTSQEKYDQNIERCLKFMQVNTNPERFSHNQFETLQKAVEILQKRSYDDMVGSEFQQQSSQELPNLTPTKTTLDVESEDRQAQFITPTKKIKIYQQTPLFSLSNIKTSTNLSSANKNADKDNTTADDLSTKIEPSTTQDQAPSSYKEMNVLAEYPQYLKTIWLENGDTYYGQLVNNLFDGYGTLHYSKSDPLDRKYYKGAWKEGKREGYGTLKFKNGSKYKGECKNDMANGLGVFMYHNGEKYIGDWVDDKAHGKGKFYYLKGDVYNGDWKNNYKDGNGSYTYVTGECYEGEYQKNCMNGYGVYSYENGDVYMGNFVNNIKCGYGELIYKLGDKYKGQFKNDQKEGEGKFVNTSGHCWKGMFVNDKLFGFAIFIGVNGEKYKGEFMNNERHGFGVQYQSNGIKYKGKWMNDKQNGQGSLYYPNGDIQIDIWEQGKKCNQDVHYKYAPGGTYKAYRGQMDKTEDYPHGYGILIDNDNNICSGYFKNNQRRGTFYYQLHDRTFISGEHAKGEGFHINQIHNVHDMSLGKSDRSCFKIKIEMLDINYQNIITGGLETSGSNLEKLVKIQKFKSFNALNKIRKRCLGMLNLISKVVNVRDFYQKKVDVNKDKDGENHKTMELRFPVPINEIGTSTDNSVIDELNGEQMGNLIDLGEVVTSDDDSEKKSLCLSKKSVRSERSKAINRIKMALGYCNTTN